MCFWETSLFNPTTSLGGNAIIKPILWALKLHYRENKLLDQVVETCFEPSDLTLGAILSENNLPFIYDDAFFFFFFFYKYIVKEL